MLAPTDTDLVRRLLADDIAAFDTLYCRYKPALYANILKLVKNEQPTQDLLQDVFITLWERRQTLDARQPVANWLFAISYYKSITHLKKVLKEQLAFEAVTSYNTTIEKEEHNENKLALMQQAIHQLSPQKRRVVEGCKLAGKSYKEVAAEMNISKHTVKEYLSLALTSLRSVLK